LLVACWSVKGGVGTTVVTAALALQLAREHAAGAVLADLAGDAPAVLGLPEPSSPGLAGWLGAGEHVPADALARLEVEAAPGLALLPRGAGPLLPARAGVLAALLDSGPRVVVADCGRVDVASVAVGAATDRTSYPADPVAAIGAAPADEAAVAHVAVAAQAQLSLLVVRSCYLALQRVRAAVVRPTGVILVDEPGRVLTGADIEAAAKAPIVATVPLDPKVARVVDSGLLRGRLPRSLDTLRSAA
jgi:hypothetical protein